MNVRMLVAITVASLSLAACATQPASQSRFAPPPPPPPPGPPAPVPGMDHGPHDVRGPGNAGPRDMANRRDGRDRDDDREPHGFPRGGDDRNGEFRPFARGGDSKPQTLAGKVQALNLTPRGDIDGLQLMVDGKLAQVNVPPDAVALLLKNVKVGDTVSITATEIGGMRPGMFRGMERGGWQARGWERGPATAASGRGATTASADRPTMHKVYRLASIKDGSGKEIVIPKEGATKPAHVEGTVKNFNYDPRGMVNGLVLESGELVLVEPMATVRMDLEIGKKVTVDGKSSETLSGVKVIEATTINGKSVRMGRDGEWGFQRGGDGKRDHDDEDDHHGGRDNHDDHGPGDDHDGAHHGPGNPGGHERGESDDH